MDNGGQLGRDRERGDEEGLADDGVDNDTDTLERDGKEVDEQDFGKDDTDDGNAETFERVGNVRDS